MKVHTNEFKEKIKLQGRELDSKITFGNTVLGLEDLNAVTPSFEGAILKSVMKQLEIDSNVEIPVGTILNYKFGLKIENEYEYLDFGKYIVHKIEKQEDTNSFTILCYDKMLLTMKKYEKLENGSFPMTVREYLTNLCLDCGLLFSGATKTFANYDKIIENDLYAGLGYTYRDIFDELSQVTAGTICLNKNDGVEVRYINDTQDTIDEEFLKDINVTFGEKFGPVNSVVLSRSAESDNVFLQDEQSVELNGLCEIKIVDNQIMNDNNRSDFLPDILEVLNGLEYYINDFKSTGVCYLELCDKYNVSIKGKIYPCILFNQRLIITQGLEEDIDTETPDGNTTDYEKADKTDQRLNRVYIIVDKQKQIIDATAEKVTDQGTAITQMKITAEGVETSIKDINDNITRIEETIDGLKTSVETVGGSNLIKDSLGALNDKSWKNSVSTIKDTYTLENSMAGQALMLNNGIIEQQIQLPNAVHTLSFTYKKNLSTINAKVYINETEYNLSETETTLFEEQINVTNNSVTIKFECDTNSGCYILDLLLNLGETRGFWTQNINETITDTVKIGKGIQVESSIANTYFRADADGTRVINKTTNEVVREDTDKGTITNEFVSRKTSIVNGILFEKVGNQRWMTGV